LMARALSAESSAAAKAFRNAELQRG
jgi:hypothetical protein